MKRRAGCLRPRDTVDAVTRNPCHFGCYDECRSEVRNLLAGRVGCSNTRTTDEQASGESTMKSKQKTAGSSPKPIPQVISFQDPLPKARHYRPQADRILSGDPAQTATNLFQSADGRFNSGIWEAERGKWRVVFTESEFCHLLAGVIVITGDDGSRRTFRAGDAFVSPAGFTGTWEIIEPARKLYAYYE